MASVHFAKPISDRTERTLYAHIYAFFILLKKIYCSINVCRIYRYIGILSFATTQPPDFFWPFLRIRYDKLLS